MKQELQEKLFKKYSKFFRQKDLNMMETCMCWGIDCGDGWFDLLDRTIEKIIKVCLDCEASQIKEKYGSLRIYLSRSNKEAEYIVEEALEESSTICEECGSTEKVENKAIREGGYWVASLCLKCRVKPQ